MTDTLDVSRICRLVPYSDHIVDIEQFKSLSNVTIFYAICDITLVGGNNVIVLPYRVIDGVEVISALLSVNLLIESFNIVINKGSLIKLYINCIANSIVTIKGGKPLLTIRTDKTLAVVNGS